jgi:hypothetical protein
MREFIGPYYLLFIILLLAAAWIWALIDIVKSTFKDSNTKIIWVVLVCVGQFIGPLLWFVLKRNFVVDAENTGVTNAPNTK